MQNNKFIRATMLVCALFFSTNSLAGEPHKVCVFDIIGKNGDIFNAMKDYQIASLDWGIDWELIPYTNERIAAEDFKAGICDAAVITGIRARLFNQYVGTLDSVGSIPNNQHMKTVLQVLSNPKQAEKMREGQFEVAGIMPLGAAYIFVNDRSINSLTKASGKRIAVLDYDKSQAKLVAQIGASPVPSDITNFAGKFNNGSVDIVAAPIVAYSALELYKGMSPDGGIINYPVAQLTFQLLVRADKFEADALQNSRKWFFGHYDSITAAITQVSTEVDPKWWVEIPAEDKVGYELLMRDARIQLRDDNHYSGDMLTLLRKVRCKFDNSRGECTDRLE